VSWPEGRRFGAHNLPGSYRSELRGTLSLREIGLKLYVSPNTVKSHAQAIYR
jgi:hypothetical protein